MKETVIVLPGTRWQIPLVKKLKKRGYYVVVFDLYENQPAYEYADEYQLVDILNKEKVLELGRAYSPVAIMSDECDIATPTIAWVSKELGKPTIGNELAELYTNKYMMREFSKRHKLDDLKYYKCSSIEEAIKYFGENKRKMIIKPLNSNSSRGVFSITSEDDLKNKFDESIKYSKGEHCIILEEYIDGEEFSIDAIKTLDGYYPLSISRKIHYSFNENLDQELIFKHHDDVYDYEKLIEKNKLFVEKSGLEFGLTHAEYKLMNGKYYLIEIGARGGGNLISSVINKCMTGIDTQELLIDWATQSQSQPREIKYEDGYANRCCLLSFVDIGDRSGTIKRINGIDYLKNCEHVMSYHFFYSIGDEVKPVVDGGTRFGYYIISCETEAELEDLKNILSAQISVEFE